MNLSALKNSTTFLLAVIVILALALRLYNINYQSLWIDEIYSMNETDPELDLTTLINNLVADQPPAFFITLHGWFKIFNYTELNGRLFSTLIGIAGVIVMFFLGKEVKDEKTGLIAALLTSINYLNILFSQEVRFYTFLFLFTSLSYLFFIRCVKSNNITNFIWYTLFTIIVVYTHYYGLVVLASQGLIFLGILMVFPINRKFISLAITSGVIVALAFSPWLPVIFSEFKITSFWIPQERFYFPIEYFYVYFKDIFACCVFAILIILFFLKIIKNIRQKEGIDQTNFVLIGWGTLSYLIPLLYSIIRTPMLHVRYTIIALPCLIIMISLSFFFLKEKFRIILLSATCVTILISLIFIEKYYTTPQKEDWRAMISSVVEQAQPGDAVVSEYSYFCNYYFKALHSEFRSEQPEHLHLSENPKNVWVMDGFDVKKNPMPVEFTLQQNGYVLKKTADFFRTRVSLYTAPEKKPI